MRVLIMMAAMLLTARAAEAQAAHLDFLSVPQLADGSTGRASGDKFTRSVPDSEQTGLQSDNLCGGLGPNYTSWRYYGDDRDQLEGKDSLRNFLMPRTADVAPADTEEVEEAPPGTLLRGLYFFGRHRYGQALPLLKKSFSRFQDEEAAQAIYYCLLYAGQSLEAQAFRNAHPLLTYALPASRFHAEYGYAEGGLRIPSRNEDAAIFYGGAGTGLRFRAPLRLRQHVFYWRQSGESRRFHQIESRTAAEWYAGKGWTLSPVLHYVYQPYHLQSESSRAVTYTARYDDGPDVYRYVTDAQQTTTGKTNGSSHSGGASIGLQKRLGAFELGLTPALQYLSESYRYRFAYVSRGNTDSSRNGQQLGSTPFYESGAGSEDTSFHQWIAQLGGSLGWRPALRGNWFYLRAGVYGLRNGDGFAVGAASVYSLLQLKPLVWLHLSALHKSGLPLLTGAEGIYLNYASRISSRFGATLQLWPLRRFSPSLTYQHEAPERGTGAPAYHSVYLTFSYQP